MIRFIQLLQHLLILAAAACLLPAPRIAQPQPGGPPKGFDPPKAGVCPLPILSALPALNDTAFFARADVPHGSIDDADPDLPVLKEARQKYARLK